ncbi:MAG TPA: hypothetical protein DHW02_17460 [Ktedonobacter sp.]|nr:hypothetical protein [Ktedonobacter sp.]
MSSDRSTARCSFCGRYAFEVQRLIAGPGAAYICETCLTLCNEILADPAPFSPKALELAARPPVVVAAPRDGGQIQASGLATNSESSKTPLRTLTLEMEQRQGEMTLILHQIQFYATHFELQYLWIRPPFRTGYAFVPRIIFSLQDSMGTEWTGARGGTLLTRQDLASGPGNAVYQGNARFQPLPAPEARTLTIRAIDPLSQLDENISHPWQFDITLHIL